MKILAVNTGSSSVKLALCELVHGTFRCLAAHDDANTVQPLNILSWFLSAQSVDVVVHRVVHGGTIVTPATVIDSDVEKNISEATSFAPLHNPHALSWIRACRVLPGVNIPQVAVFDTALYTGLPAVAATYALPHTLTSQYGIRRYGFHGIAHGDMSRAWTESRPDLSHGGRVITLQLGAGCSVTAFKNGKVVDTSMGFSPLEGLVMATRAGDVDAGALLYLQREAKLSPDDLDKLLNSESGLLGVSGVSGDMRSLLTLKEPRAQAAIDLFCYRARKYIGAYMAALGGCDGIVFGGGIGENSPFIRKKILHGLEWTGLALDADANDAAIGIERRISSGSSLIDVHVVPIDEMKVLAATAHALVTRSVPIKESAS